jgi:prepilin-type N-terminal cleavage/methylation domain-containing protein
MKRYPLRPGFTMLEVMVAAGIFTMIFLGGYTMLQTASISFDRNTRQSHADADAATAMVHVIDDLRESQLFRTPSANTLNIWYPVIENGYYNRLLSRDPNTETPDVSYYLSNATADGTSTLMRRDFRLVGNQVRALCYNVQAITCATDTDLPNALIITIRTKYTKDKGRAETTSEVANQTAKITELRQRVVFARNYNPEENNP